MAFVALLAGCGSSGDSEESPADVCGQAVKDLGLGDRATITKSVALPFSQIPADPFGTGVAPSGAPSLAADASVVLCTLAPTSGEVQSTVLAVAGGTTWWIGPAIS